MTYWCARLHPGRTGMALHLLRQLDYEPYYPQIFNGRGAEGLFSTYCFIAVRLQWSAVQYCPGVARLIGTRDRPDEVADALVESIKRREGPDGYVRLPRRAKPRKAGVQPGDRVRVTHGPLFGHDGLCVGLASHQRVTVLLQTLGRVQLARGDVRLIGE